MDNGDIHIKVTADITEMNVKLQQAISIVEKLEATYHDMGNEIKALQDKYDKLGKDAAKAFMAGDDDLFRSLKEQQDATQKEISVIKQERKEVGELITDKKAYIDQLEQEIEKSMKSSATHETVRTKLRKVREEMAALRMAGKDNTEEYQRLAEEGAKLARTQKDVQLSMQAMIDKTAGLKALTGAASVAAGGFETLSGVVEMAGGSSDNLEEAQTRLTSAIAIGNGVRNIAAQIEKKSQLLDSVRIVQMKAKNAAVALGTKNTKLATAAQKALNAVAAANPYLLLAVAILGVVSALAIMMVGARNTAKAMQELNEQEAAHLDYLQSVVDSKGYDYKEQIGDLERQLEVQKAQGASLAEQRKTEDEILRLKREQANWTSGYVGEDSKAQREELARLNDELERAQNFNGKRIKRDFGLTVNGKPLTGKTADVVKYLQDAIANLQTEIDMKTSARENRKNVEAEAAKQEAERRKEAQSRAKQAADNARRAAEAERAILRQEEDNTNALIKDLDAKEDAQLKARYDRAIADLQYRLDKEAGLTKKAKESLRRQIVQQEELRTQEEEKIARKREQRKLALQREIEQSDINGMDEGLAKDLKQIEQSYKQQTDALKAAWEERTITDEEYSQKSAIALAKRMKDEKDTLDAALKDYETYEQQRADIRERYERIIADMYTQDENGNKVLRSGFTTDNVAEAAKKMNAELASIDTQQLKESADYINYFNAYLTIGADKVHEIAQAIKSDLDAQLQAGTIDIKQYLDALREVDDIEKKVKEDKGKWGAFLEGGVQGVADYGVEIATQKQVEAYNVLKDAQQAYDNAVASGIQSAIDVEKSNLDAAKAAYSLAEADKKAADANKENADTLVKVASVVNGIADTISTAFESFKQIGESFGMDTDTAAMDYLGTGIDVLSQGAGAAVSFLTGDIAGGIKQTIQAVTSLIVGLNNAADSELQRSIEQHMDNIEELGDKISEAYGSDKAALIREQEENLRRQTEELREALQDEEDKKNTDEDAVADYDQQIADNEKALEDLHQAELDAIFGQDIQSAIRQLADGIVDAWEQGEDAAKAFTDLSKQWIEDALKQELLSYIQKQQYAERIREKIAEAMSGGSDGGTQITQSEWNAIKDYSQVLGNELQNELGWMSGYFEDLEEGSGRGSTKKGIAAASQDSIDELNGRMTAVQGHTYSINENTRHIMNTVNEILYAIRSIDRTVGDINRAMNGVRNDIVVMRNNSNTMASVGVKLK